MDPIEKQDGISIEDTEILENIEAGLEGVRAFKEGILQTTSAKDFLNEL